MIKFYQFQKYFIAVVALMCFSVRSIGQQQSSVTNKFKEEVRKVEKEFETDLNKYGAGFAFEKYAAPDAVIKRANDSLIFGSKAIKGFYSGDNYKNAKANWSPDYIDVSSDGTLAYTYGKYQWVFIDKTGQRQEYKGVFHTVWKKQINGDWKYVWD
jgi:ketosteroid isomerase-like protein